MNIFLKIKNSIYNPKYYNEVIEKPFSYSLKYLLVFALLFALVFTIVATIKFIPVVNFLSEKAPQIANYFPQELTVIIKDGKVLTNVQEPYFIKIPQEMKDNNIQTDATNFDNLVVIDTKNKFDIDTFKSYKTFVLLTLDSIVYIDGNNQISIGSLSEVKNFTLNKEKVLSFINIVKPFLVILYPIVFVGAYIIGYGVVMFNMIYLLFGALGIWAVARIKGVKIGYKKSYQVGIHLMTSAIIIVSILGAFSIKSPIPYLFSILLIISAVLNLKKNTEQSSISTPVN